MTEVMHVRRKPRGLEAMQWKGDQSDFEVFTDWLDSHRIETRTIYVKSNGKFDLAIHGYLTVTPGTVLVVDDPDPDVSARLYYVDPDRFMKEYENLPINIAPPDHPNAVISGDEPYSFDALTDTGMLWLINRVVFHPRGFAFALAVDKDGNVFGWKIIGDGSEPWSFDDSNPPTEKELFARVNDTLKKAQA